MNITALTGAGVSIPVQGHGRLLFVVGVRRLGVGQVLADEVPVLV